MCIRDRNDIDFKIYSREKTPFSIWRKIQKKRTSLEQITDIIGFRIILDNVELNNNYLLPNENINFMDIEDISDEEENYSPFIDVPHMWDREIRHFAIDNGADLVIVHHPHVIQGFEVYNEKLIAHSLGNFVFDLSSITQPIFPTSSPPPRK